MLINGPWPGSGCAQWRRTSPILDTYDLVLHDRVLARLAIGGENRIAARVEADGCELVFVSEGLADERIWITQVGPDGELLKAGFRWQPPRHDGVLTMIAGGRIAWRKLQWSVRGGHILLDRYGHRLLHFWPDGTVCGYDVDVDLDASPETFCNILLLVALGWLLLVAAGEAAPPRRTA
jgi:hypothetical protein